MDFATAAKGEAKWTRTENAALALNTTGSALLDFYATVGALRDADETRICGLFAGAWAENPLLAVKTVFYARDVRGGLGERATFRALLRYMATHHPEGLKPNLGLIGFYGRFDDLYSLIDTPLESEMWATMKRQFEADREALNTDKGAVSLLAKWIKTADAKSRATRELGIKTALALGYRVFDFKRLVRALRRRIEVVEVLMTQGRWSEIRYPTVPSRAMLLYRRAFQRHDSERFGEFINRAVRGEEQIKAGALFPYDLVMQIWSFGGPPTEEATVEAQWRQLPDYVGRPVNALVMADVSGSMTCCGGRPLATSVGLAIYFAERNRGAYQDLFLSFSAEARFQRLKGETLAQKIASIDMDAWDMNTSLEAAFNRVLGIALKNRVPPEEMPLALIVISDMEIDACCDDEWTFYDEMQARFRASGYELPNVIFWNVASRHNVFHADRTRRGVQLVSGQSASVFRQVMDAVGMTPVEAMKKTLESERYAPIRVE